MALTKCVHKKSGKADPPGGAGRGFSSSLGAALPDTVGHVVADGGQDLG